MELQLGACVGSKEKGGRSLEALTHLIGPEDANVAAAVKSRPSILPRFKKRTHNGRVSKMDNLNTLPIAEVQGSFVVGVLGKEDFLLAHFYLLTPPVPEWLLVATCVHAMCWWACIVGHGTSGNEKKTIHETRAEKRSPKVVSRRG